LRILRSNGRVDLSQRVSQIKGLGAGWGGILACSGDQGCFREAASQI
jgi:hypothetical protein